MIDLNAIKAAAEAAMPGPWDFDTADTPYRIAGGEVVGGDALPYGDVYTVAEWETPEGPECLIITTEVGVDNGRFIAAANPAAVLELIALTERLQAELNAERAAARPAVADTVAMPTSADQAALMALLGTQWLEQHAPERLKAPADAGQAQALADEDKQIIATFEKHIDKELDTTPGIISYWIKQSEVVEAVRACMALRQPETRLDVISLIHSQMHRVYASAIDREEVDTAYMREIEDAINGIYHGRYIAGYDLRKAEEVATAPVSQPAQCAAPDERATADAIVWLLANGFMDWRGGTGDDEADAWSSDAAEHAEVIRLVQQARASLAPPAPAAAPDAQPDLLANFLDLTQLVAAWASSSKYEADMIDKVRELQPHIKAAITAAQPEQQPVGEVVLFGNECKEISWAKGKMPPVGAKLYAAPVPAAAPKPLQDLWQQGVLMAAGIVVACHDMPVVAATILNELSAQTADCSALDEFDKASLRKVQGELSGAIALRGLAAAPVGGGDHG